MAKKTQSPIPPLNPNSGVKLHATITEGWRVTQADQDRLVMVHPDHPPRIVEMRSIREGDVLPRDIDMVLGIPPAIGGA